ncbi:MAG: tRNA lysidine(34) synthetase TilS [Bacteroidota bacterium]|jgi:tRNA(Ile)-lysidine synthase
MIKDFQHYISEHQLFTKNDKLLVAISGGVDSMVLTDLLRQGHYQFALAHCNFQLRSDESDGDEHFVCNYAQKSGLVVHVQHFETADYAQKYKLSIQEAARNLRYDWFESLRQQFDYQYVITAHHGTDTIETVLYHFVKGTGLRGLTGIPIKGGNGIRRPLLFATKSMILDYAAENEVDYREDTSNASDKYMRNYIRHEIVPDMAHINPQFEETALRTIEKLREAHWIYEDYIHQFVSKHVISDSNQVKMEMTAIQSSPVGKTILYELLKSYGFSTAQTLQIIKSTRSGATFDTETHRLWVDRAHYIVQSHQQIYNQLPIKIDSDMTEILWKDINLKIHLMDNDLSFNILRDSSSAQLDFDKLIFPLTLRIWAQGDKFQPLGMNGNSQKVSDFLNNYKISNGDKIHIKVLENGNGDICWIVGWRLDERYKIVDKTNKIFEINIGKINF